jgi:hypothetical protein
MISFMIALLYIYILMIFYILLTHGHRLVRHGDRVVAPGTAGDATPRRRETLFVWRVTSPSAHGNFTWPKTRI